MTLFIMWTKNLKEGIGIIYMIIFEKEQLGNKSKELINGAIDELALKVLQSHPRNGKFNHRSLD